jgi:hypothetical protein
MKKVLALFVLLLGGVVAFTALWAGSYYVHKYTYQDWQQFPTLMTSMFAFIGGAVMVSVGAFKLTEA